MFDTLYPKLTDKKVQWPVENIQVWSYINLEFNLDKPKNSREKYLSQQPNLL